MAKIIAMMNQKGGVGKTTSAINLAACLAVAEKRTLIIDLDPQGNGSVSVGLDSAQHTACNIYHALIGEANIKNAIYKTELPYFDICPSDNNLSGAEIELVSLFAREAKLKVALMEVSDDYDFIIIDCPPSLGLLTVNALNAADTFIVPMQTEYLAMEGLAQLVNTVKLIKASLNPRLEMEGILLTMFDARSSLHKQVAGEIRKHFADKVFETVIPRNVKLAECPSFGKPIILYDIESKGSEAYLALAKELILRSRAQAVNVANTPVQREVPPAIPSTHESFSQQQL
ncbi:sporulation initiation inhibitor protein Soj [Bacteriovorax sp. BSW11_IV]|uniref:ParA family protein n=1 Tax=Bacteriovorax sp. BSW11_IV TaxID=1353529 RepID=UPI00038A3B04|nr:AAA family ATPase [Bacteriovorax sp. BSW11_IV]EQC50013.1 sporulation initiation inhibitor protein Soj [Bacteriovorax sp. BSW11_IV]